MRASHLGGGQKCCRNEAVLPLPLGGGEMTVAFILPEASHLSQGCRARGSLFLTAVWLCPAKLVMEQLGPKVFFPEFNKRRRCGWKALRYRPLRAAGELAPRAPIYVESALF